MNEMCSWIDAEIARLNNIHGQRINNDGVEEIVTGQHFRHKMILSSVTGDDIDMYEYARQWRRDWIPTS